MYPNPEVLPQLVLPYLAITLHRHVHPHFQVVQVSPFFALRPFLFFRSIALIG